LHLPLQSGSDAILRAMNRPYSTEDFRDIMERAREAVPGIALTTDIMAGFPGEGEEEHRQSLEFVEAMAFSRIHVFAYSRRPGTPAAAMPGQVAEPVKDRRSRELIRIGEIARECYGNSRIGLRHQVLIEEEISGGCWAGHSENYLEVTAALPAAPGADQGGTWKGRLLPLKITGKSALKPEAWQGVLDGDG
jgi:threonylcarbamoyladenosine tRNA methylthiotransferase MtaB